MKHRLFLAFAALLSLSGQADAADSTIRASCTQGGRIVYREDLPAGTPADRRLEIANAYRTALCVFLKADNAPPTLPDIVDPALAGVVSGGNEDLASALSYLSTGQTAVGTPYGGAFDKGMKDFMRSENVFKSEEGSVNLTIAVYSGAKPEDVLGHWAYIKNNTVYLAKMTPSIETVGDTTVLSVENVSDGFAARVCEEAQKVASGCLAVY